MPVLSTLGAAIANVYGFTSGLIKDQYFNLVSLLLPGNGTDGKQNRTFKDSSVNDFLITPNGNTTQGTFSPFSQTGWGNYFNGSSYISTPGFNFSTSDFTIECFVNTSSLTAGPQPISGYTTTGLNYTIALTAGGVWSYYLSSNGSSWDIASGVVLGTATVGKWHHIVIVRSGNSIRGYFDGTGGTTTTSSAAIYNNSTAFYIGAAGSAGGNLTGYFSNVRVLLGTAAYSPASSTITVPTAPFTTGTTNQVLLTCQANRFIDSNTATTAKTITVSGSAQVTPFSPFAPTQSYSASAVGGSGYFDGTGDYLSMTSGTSLGSGDFTISAWVYLTAAPSTETTVGSSYNYYTTGNNGNFVFRVGTSSLWASFDGQSNVASISGSYTWQLNTWIYMSWVRSGSTVTVYRDGVSLGSTTDTKTLSNTANGYVIGSGRVNGSIASPLTGYISDLRVVVGSAITTVPTAPLTAVSGTSLLLNFTNAGVVDATAKNVLETVGNAQISTTQSKWGGGSSISFDGTGDYLLAPVEANQNYNFGSGDFTVECWFYANSLSTTSYAGLMGCNYANVDGNTSAWAAYVRSNGIFFYGNTGTLTGVSGTVNTGVWNHYAVTRSGNTLRLFLNGTQTTSATVTGTYTNSTVGFRVGDDPDSSNPAFNGYIDDVRITKGYARYVEGTGGNAGKMVFNGTNTLSLPTAPFPVQ